MILIILLLLIGANCFVLGLIAAEEWRRSFGPQTYFWTEEWQQGEREADAEIKAGQTSRFISAAETIHWLEEKE